MNLHSGKEIIDDWIDVDAVKQLAMELSSVDGMEELSKGGPAANDESSATTNPTGVETSPRSAVSPPIANLAPQVKEVAGESRHLVEEARKMAESSEKLSPLQAAVLGIEIDDESQLWGGNVQSEEVKKPEEPLIAQDEEASEEVAIFEIVEDEVPEVKTELSTQSELAPEAAKVPSIAGPPPVASKPKPAPIQSVSVQSEKLPGSEGSELNTVVSPMTVAVSDEKSDPKSQDPVGTVDAANDQAKPEENAGATSSEKALDVSPQVLVPKKTKAVEAEPPAVTPIISAPPVTPPKVVIRAKEVEPDTPTEMLKPKPSKLPPLADVKVSDSTPPRPIPTLTHAVPALNAEGGSAQFKERVAEFAKGMLKLSGAQSLFVADRDGEVIHGEGSTTGTEDLIGAMARTVWFKFQKDQSKPVREQEHLDSGYVLSMGSTQTRYGFFALGVLHVAPLTDQQVDFITAEFKKSLTA